MTDAVVVGSGPNGLAGAVVLAQAGLRVTVLEAKDTIGGGTRTEELLIPGVRHDVCSAAHPFGVASPIFTTLRLEEHGLRWRWPEVDLAHPLDGGTAGVMTRDLDETAKALEQDGDRWTKTFANLAERFDDLVEDLFRPIQHVPAHPILFARFGLNAALPATAFVRRFRTDEAKALFAGVAAHAFQPLGRPLTSAVGLTMIAAGHHAGWPVAEGGSAAITAALAGKLAELGGRVECHTPVKTLPDADVVLLDVSPRAAAHIIGERLPSRTRRAYHRWRHGPAAYKVDLVVEGGIPWTNEACRRAGTLHLGGTIEEIARAERDIHYDRLPQRPFMLVGQQYLADPTRSNGSQYPIWAYAHVPNGYDGDATDVVLNQIERFAPGFKARIIAHTATRPHDLELYNPNYVGGDIATGANDPLQIALRPRMAIDPYATGVPGVYLCSAATPPGAGVHGMCGANAARSALRSLA